MFWRINTKQISDASMFLDRPNILDDEMFRLSANALHSEELATFAIKELLPILSSGGDTKETSQIIIDNFEKFKKEKNK